MSTVERVSPALFFSNLSFKTLDKTDTVLSTFKVNQVAWSKKTEQLAGKVNWAKLNYSTYKNETYWEPFYYNGYSSDYSGSLDNGKYYHIYFETYNSNGSNYKSTYDLGVHRLATTEYSGGGWTYTNYTYGLAFIDSQGRLVKVSLTRQFANYSHNEWRFALSYYGSNTAISWKEFCSGSDTTGGITMYFVELPIYED